MSFAALLADVFGAEWDALDAEERAHIETDARFALDCGTSSLREYRDNICLGTEPGALKRYVRIHRLRM